MRFQSRPFSIHFPPTLRFLRFSGCTFSAKLARLRDNIPASPACIASFGSSGMMLVLLGCCPVLGSARFVTLWGDATKILENRLNQSANPSPLIRAGPAQNVCAWSAHGRRHGAHGLIPEGKPYRALACGPITSGGRIYTLTRHSRPPGTLPCPFCHVPFL